MPEKDQLYVKIEGHEDLLQELNSVNQLVQNIEEADEVLDQIRELKQKTIQNIRENVMELNQRIENVHREMPRVEEGGAANVAPKTDLEAPDDPAPRNEEIDESVNQLHNQLETLKDELEELE
jgi:DNA repair exonuclease SbcCD ATPase subunit